MRPHALALLLVLPMLAGCADEPAEGLARPTAVTVWPSVPQPATPKPVVYNDSDPGYAVTAPLRVGDGWDYESNASRREYRTIRVAEARAQADRTLVRLEETYGVLGNAPDARLTRWVDASTWTLVEAVDDVGGRTRYDPPQPLRFYRNRTFEFNATSEDRFTGATTRDSYLVASYVEPAWETVRLPWGSVPAVHVVHDVYANGARSPSKLDYWVHLDYAQPARYAAGGVGWTLVALKEGDRVLGQLQAT